MSSFTWHYCGLVFSRLHPLIVPFIWSLVGLASGACLTLLVIKDLSPDWIEATGTWFGAVATVLTLLWAVRSFRSDQAEREAIRISERENDLALRLVRDRDQANEAHRVNIELKGRAASGTSPNQVLTSVAVEITNKSRHLVVVDGLILDEALKTKTPLPPSFRIPAGESEIHPVEIAEIPYKEGDLNGGPLSRFSVQMSYRQDGYDWIRCQGGFPERS